MSFDSTLYQEYTSKDTCINAVSAVYKYIDKHNIVILDYGGGKYNTNVEYMKNKCGSTVLVYDPFNRSDSHNTDVLNYFKVNPAEYVVLSNVLNVIKEDEIIYDILNNVKTLMSETGSLYIKIYERDRSGKGCLTVKGWQRNQKLNDYIPYLKNVFGESCAIEKNKEILILNMCSKKS